MFLDQDKTEFFDRRHFYETGDLIYMWTCVFSPDYSRLFKFRGFTKAFTNFAKYIIAFIFAKFKYFAKQIIYLESPDHVLQNDI